MIIQMSAMRKKPVVRITAPRKAWLRRQAVNLAAQLPENPDEAQYVLEAAKELLESFLAPVWHESRNDPDKQEH